MWDAFEAAIERAQSDLERAREEYDAVANLGGQLRAVYGTALDELAEDVEAFDSVLQVDESARDAALDAAGRAELLAAIIGAFREYLETQLEQQVTLLDQWFEGLRGSINESSNTIQRDLGGLERKIMVARKLVDAGKHTQLRTSEKVYIEEIDADVRELDKVARRELPPEIYIEHLLPVTEAYHDQYTDVLADLVSAEVDRSAISMKDQVAEAPGVESIQRRFNRGEDLDRDDATQIGETLAVYYEIALDTTQRRAAFELSEALIDAVSDADSVKDDVEAELWELTSTLDIGALRERVARLVGSATITSDREQLLRLLREHDGSVRRTMRTVDEPPREFFGTLRTLFLNEEIADMEATFE